MSPLGPAAMMAGRLLIPLSTGLGVYDPASGANERVIPVNHPAGNGPVVPDGHRLARGRAARRRADRASGPRRPG